MKRRLKMALLLALFLLTLTTGCAALKSQVHYWFSYSEWEYYFEHRMEEDLRKIEYFFEYRMEEDLQKTDDRMFDLFGDSE